MRIQYSLSGALLSLTAALIIEGAFALPLIFAWLIGINAFTLVFYSIDKLNSKSSAPEKVRIPEFTLLFLALAGGSPAAALAMIFLPHKISKASFLLPYLLILAGQGAAIYYLHDTIPWP
ncbi:MAG: DUF1294 domain-containing protein [Anaerolineae bacterium]|jgi:uncharacterized membrane protein YsdA (DUF1294 family)